MTRETFKSWCKSNGVTSINKEIRTNTNGYPFITILRDKDAENIYFGRKSAAKVELGDSVKAIANDIYVTIAVGVDLLINGGHSITLAPAFESFTCHGNSV